jgi:hypothetical protein
MGGFMKKIILFSLVVLSANAANIQEELCKVQKLAKEARDMRIEDEKALEKALLETGLGQEYMNARKNWFREGCAEQGESLVCKQATKMFETALTRLQETDIYRQKYLPNLKAEYLNARKCYMFAFALSLPGEERVAGIEKYMQEEGNVEPSKLWLELSHDRGELNKQAMAEVRDFILGNIKKA